MPSYEDPRSEDTSLGAAPSGAPRAIAADPLREAFYRFAGSQGEGSIVEQGQATAADRISLRELISEVRRSIGSLVEASNHRMGIEFDGVSAVQFLALRQCMHVLCAPFTGGRIATPVVQLAVRTNAGHYIAADPLLYGFQAVGNNSFCFAIAKTPGDSSWRLEVHSSQEALDALVTELKVDEHATRGRAFLSRSPLMGVAAATIDRMHGHTAEVTPCNLKSFRWDPGDQGGRFSIGYQESVHVGRFRLNERLEPVFELIDPA